MKIVVESIRPSAKSGCPLCHSRCEDGQRNDDADQKCPYSRHDAIEVAPPSCFLEGLVVGGAHRLGELLLQVGLTNSGGAHSVGVQRQGKERGNYPSCIPNQYISLCI